MSTRLRVVHVEDTAADCELALAMLERQWPDLEFERVETEEAFRRALSRQPDLVIADIEVPGFGAMSALRILADTSIRIPLLVPLGCDHARPAGRMRPPGRGSLPAQGPVGRPRTDGQLAAAPAAHRIPIAAMDLLAYCGSLVTRLEQRLFEPAPTGASRILVVLRYPFALLRDLARGDLTLRAMSLVYTTLLSIVPLIALSFSVLKGLGYHRALEPLLYRFLEPLGERAAEITARVMQFVENVQSGVLGSLGLAFLLYTVISMIQKVEESFNYVWRVEQPRSLGRRFSEYLSVMVVGPVVMVAAMGLLATIGSNGMVQFVAHTQFFGGALAQIGRLRPYALVAGVFTFMYAFIPNTKVSLRAAAIGGVVAGVSWSASGELFTAIVVHSSRTMAIYAGFAIVIVGLMWLYLSWLILLLGVQLAFYIQHPQFLRSDHGEPRLTSSLKERLALSLMYLVAQGLPHHGPRVDAATAVQECSMYRARRWAPCVACLERRGLLVATEAEKLVPGKDLGSIGLAEILDAVRNDSEGPHGAQGRCLPPADAVAREAEAAIRASMNGRTLKDLVGGDKG